MTSSDATATRPPRWWTCSPTPGLGDGRSAATPTLDDLLAAGMNEPVARSWLKTGLTLGDIHEWVTAGVRPGSAIPYRELGAVTVDDARWLVAHRIRATDANRYAAAKLPFTDLRKLVEDGLTPEDAAAYAAAGITGKHSVEAFHTAGVDGPTAEAFARHNITSVSQIRSWEARGVTTNKLRQFDGYDLDEIARLAKLVKYPGQLGYFGTLPRMDVDLVERIVTAGIDPHWTVVLHDAGLLTAMFLRRHHTVLAATKPPEKRYSWDKPTREDIHRALGLATDGS